MKIRLRSYVLILLLLLLGTAALETLIRERSRASVLKPDFYRQEAFLEQRLEPELYEEIRKRTETEGDFGDVLTATMLEGNFSPEKVSEKRGPYVRFKPGAYRALKECYEAVWADIRRFPILDRNISYEISYEDSFGEPRSYGGARSHEGTDLFGRRKEPGYYPVVSMTEGVVENIGWLPLGGYRIGVRAPGGGYFYYAHLSEYEREFREGEQVEAGEILGFMGDTGYGQEGTRGRFPVHLHLGIYIRTPEGGELGVNPYWAPRAAESLSLI